MTGRFPLLAKSSLTLRVGSLVIVFVFLTADVGAAWFAPHEFHEQVDLRLRAHKPHRDAIAKLYDVSSVASMTVEKDAQYVSKQTLQNVYQLLQKRRAEGTTPLVRIIIMLQHVDATDSVAYASGSHDPQERLRQARQALLKHRWSFEVFNAIRGSSSPRAVALQTRLGMSLSAKALTVSQRGIWLSHVSNIEKALNSTKMVVSLESDCMAIAPWPGMSPDMENYDILGLHTPFYDDFSGFPGWLEKYAVDHCVLSDAERRDRGDHGIRTGQLIDGAKGNFAAGALLINPTHADRIRAALAKVRNERKPWDHWLNHASAMKWLRVGALCPRLFRQYFNMGTTQDKN